MTEKTTFLLRIDAETKLKLKRRAAELGRSLNGYLNYLLHDLVKGWEEEGQLENRTHAPSN